MYSIAFDPGQMRFLVDKALSPDVLRGRSAAGYDAIDAHDIGPEPRRSHIYSLPVDDSATVIYVDTEFGTLLALRHAYRCCCCSQRDAETARNRSPGHPQIEGWPHRNGLRELSRFARCPRCKTCETVAVVPAGPVVRMMRPSLAASDCKRARKAAGVNKNIAARTTLFRFRRRSTLNCSATSMGLRRVTARMAPRVSNSSDETRLVELVLRVATSTYGLSFRVLKRVNPVAQRV